MTPYKSWRQVAGYFDGDGTIGISDTSNQPYKLSLSLIFVDQSYDQMRNVGDLLGRYNLRTSNILKTSEGSADMVAVSEFRSVKRAPRCMLPFLCKKANGARAAPGYYEGKTTGNQLVVTFQDEVKAGRREDQPRKVTLDVPYTRVEGDEIMKRLRGDRLRDAIGRYGPTMTGRDFRSIRTKYYDKGRRVRELVREYPRYSRETIRRTLGKGRRYMLVKSVGRVDTTDTTLRSAWRARRGVDKR